MNSRRAAAINAFADVSAPVRALARKDAALRRAARTIGKPHIRRREGGFPGLFRIIVEQQVSVPSAQAIWKRCIEGAAHQDPAAIIALGEPGLKARGLSGPKARYVLGAAETVQSGAIEFSSISGMSDEDAMAALVSLKGVGPWTASIYLLFCEGRIDIWPPNDVALKAAYGAAAGGDITQKALDSLADGWSPYRGVAAHILWTYYAHIRGRTPI